MIGQTLGHYRIEEQLGAGGMGVVYRATDSKLGRQVAIKVLPESFAKDPERLARFQREARMLAALNHPNIAAIHGLEESGGTHYLVLEYVPGNTLEGPLPLAEALRVASQIAEAFEAAHEKDIVHRDLKPANVKVTPEGKVKVLDFGLAKAVTAQPTDATVSQAGEGTQLGAVMGTAGYMSPEQARGLPVDKRCDIWAFGCVLYETLTGRRAFGGRTLSDSIAAVLAGEPDWEALPVETPPHVRALLRRCLQKDLGRRQRDIGDARLELEETRPGDEATGRGGESRSRWRALTVAAGSLLLGALLAGVVGWSLRPKGPPAAVARFAVDLPPNEIVTFDHAPSAVLSPDGTRLLYSATSAGGGRQLYLRRLDQLEAKPIPGTAGARNPFFSPDGQWVAFWQNFKLRKLALSGGAPVALTDVESIGGSHWAPDGTILVSGYPEGVWRIPAGGGTRREVTDVDASKGERSHRLPQLVPGGKAVLFTIAPEGVETYDDARIAVQSLETGDRKILIEGGTGARYSPTGHIVYARGGALLAAPFDVQRLRLTGTPVPVLEGVFQSLGTGTVHFSLSDDGTLAYVPGSAVGAGRVPVWVDRQGREETLALPSRAYLHPRISPDGRQLAIEIEGTSHNSFIYDVARGVLSKFSTDGTSHWPLWTPDGKRLTFRSWRTAGFTMWWAPADRSGAEERLADGTRQSAASWSPDGRVVAFTQLDPETGADLWVLEVGGGRKPVPFLRTKFNEGSPRFSPGPKGAPLWIAFSSNESGRNEVYVQAYPGPGARTQVSSEGGFDPVWTRSGRELFYRSGNKMMAVAVTTGAAFSAGRPQMLWERFYAHGLSSVCGAPGPSSSNYDVTPDGQRFLMIKENEQDGRYTRIHVVLNWAEELKRIMQEKQKKS